MTTIHSNSIAKIAMLEAENAVLKALLREYMEAIHAESLAGESCRVAVENFSDHKREERDWMKTVARVSEIEARLRLAV